MNRRGFLASILAAGVAPAFIGSSVLMPVKSLVMPEKLIVDPLVGKPSFGDYLTQGDVITISGQTHKDGRLIQYVVTDVSDEKIGIHPYTKEKRRIVLPKNQPWPKQGRWA